jgi:hypothetical protein
MSKSTARRFQIVGVPFYRFGTGKVLVTDLPAGTVVSAPADRHADEDGDLLVTGPDGFRQESISIEALVEIDEDGYPVQTPSFVLNGEPEDALLAALAPIAVVLLRGSL